MAILTKTSVKSLHRIVLIFLTFLFYADQVCASQSSRKEPKRKKTDITIYTPEPDQILSKSPIHKRVQPSREAKNPLHANTALNIDGIDVSHYQGNIDWRKVAKANISYAYLKATEGASLVDDTYWKNLTEAKRHRIKVGSYHFYRANVSVEEQFQNMTATVKASDQNLLPVIDVEIKPRRISDEKFIKDLKLFLERITQHYGRKPVIYTFYNFYNRYLSGKLPGYVWMIARYSEEAPELNDGQEYIIWQYTSNGELDGISGPVDRSKIMNSGSLEDLSF